MSLFMGKHFPSGLMDALWIYLVFPNFENIPHPINFWNYQNLLAWFSQKIDKEFCFAIPENILEWGPVPASAYDYEGFLKDRFQFEMKWIFDLFSTEIIFYGNMDLMTERKTAD